MYESQVKRLLPRLRKQGDVTQQQLADRSGLSVDMIRSLETGRRGAAEDTVEALIRGLELPENALEREELLAAAAPPGSLKRDRFRQRLARQVWVISRYPAELWSDRYRELLRDNLVGGHIVEYTYWTSTPTVFDELKDVFRTYYSDEADRHFETHVRCIECPVETDWTTFVLCDPHDPDIRSGVTSPGGGRPGGDRVLPISHHHLVHVVDYLSRVHRTLCSLPPGKESHRHYRWYYGAPPTEELHSDSQRRVTSEI